MSFSNRSAGCILKLEAVKPVLAAVSMSASWRLSPHEQPFVAAGALHR